MFPRGLLRVILAAGGLAGGLHALLLLGAGTPGQRVVLGIAGAWLVLAPVAILLLVLRFLRRRPVPALPGARFLGGVVAVLALGVAGITVAAMLPGGGGQGAELRLPPAPDGLPAASGPDLVLISVDTLRADAVTGPRPRGFDLPVLDRLRREGTWARYALSGSNQTLPGHLNMLTGLDAMHTGVRYNLEPVPGDLEFLAERLHAAGWRTAGVVSNALIAGDLGFSRGFELYDDATVASRREIRALARAFRTRTPAGLLLRAWLGEEQAERKIITALDLTLLRRQRRSAVRVHARGRGATTNERAGRILEQLLEQEHPYFLFVHYMDPHDPYGAPAPFDGTITAALDRPDARWLPAEPGGLITGDMAEAVQADLQAGVEGAEKAAAFYHHVYLEEVAYVDSLVGELLARIEASGRPTVVLFTGDHGEHFGEHGLMKHANSLYEELLRVPFLLWGAGVPQGRRLQAPVFLEDVAPTLLSLAGLPAERMDGRPVLAPAPKEPRVHVAADNHHFSLRSRDLKWIGRWVDDAEVPVRSEGLFRLSEDPRELQDLSGGAVPPPELAPLVKAALERDRHARIAGLGVSEEQRQAFHELGYAE